MKRLVAPLEDHSNLDRPGCIFLSKKWIRSWNNPSVSGERAAMILLKFTKCACEHFHQNFIGFIYLFILTHDQQGHFCCILQKHIRLFYKHNNSSNLIFNNNDWIFLSEYSLVGNACWNLFGLSVYFQLASPQCNKCSDNMVLMIHWVSLRTTMGTSNWSGGCECVRVCVGIKKLMFAMQDVIIHYWEVQEHGCESF